jgi:hypothetical protein
LVQESHWDPRVLQYAETRVSEDELRHFEAMGEVTADEVLEFHYALQRLSSEPDGEA